METNSIKQEQQYILINSSFEIYFFKSLKEVALFAGEQKGEFSVSAVLFQRSALSPEITYNDSYSLFEDQQKRIDQAEINKNEITLQPIEGNYFIMRCGLAAKVESQNNDGAFLVSTSAGLFEIYINGVSKEGEMFDLIYRIPS